MPQTEPQGRSKSGIIAAILHELLKREHFTSSADLQEALKCECARLHVPYDGESIINAIVFVDRTRQVIFPGKAVARPQGVEPVPLSRAEAADICAVLLKRFQEEYPAVAPVRSADWPEHFPDLMEILS